MRGNWRYKPLYLAFWLNCMAYAKIRIELLFRLTLEENSADDLE